MHAEGRKLKALNLVGGLGGGAVTQLHGLFLWDARQAPQPSTPHLEDPSRLVFPVRLTFTTSPGRGSGLSSVGESSKARGHPRGT